MRWIDDLRTRTRERQRGDRGATLVEAAFVMPVFVLLVFGIFEFSGATMTKTGAGSAVKAGARMAVVSGNETMADRNILRRMEKEGAGLLQDHIVQIVIWNAEVPGEDPPAPCLTSSIYKGGTDYGACNTYNNPQAVAFSRARLPIMTSGDTYGSAFSDYYFGCTGPSDPESQKLDCGWPSADRRALEPSPTIGCPTPRPNRRQVATGADPRCLDTDLVGIYIEVLHDNYTGFFGSQVTVKESTTAKIEPQGYDK